MKQLGCSKASRDRPGLRLSGRAEPLQQAPHGTYGCLRSSEYPRQPLHSGHLCNAYVHLDLGLFCELDHLGLLLL